MIMRGDRMKNKIYQPMDPKDAINYIYNNQYDSPRKMISGSDFAVIVAGAETASSGTDR